MKKIIFWDETVNSNKTGGTIRIQELLTKEYLGVRDVLIIGNKNSSVVNKLLMSKVKFQTIEPKQELVEKYVSKNDLVIVFWMNSKIKILKKINPYILFWNVYPLFSSMNFLRRFRYYLLIKEMYLKNSFSVMDEECKKVILKRFNINLNNGYLRIPINISENYYKYKIIKNINITYIGRGDSNALWKIKAIAKLSKDLSNLKKGSFKLHIFTDFSELFEKELDTYKSENFKIEFHFGYWGSKLTKKLIEISDLHYSMGTSMLEGAKLGIPTIIADAGWNDFPDNYRYRWLIDDVENYAGKFIDNTKEFQGVSIENLINDILNREKMIYISEQQYDLVKKTFSSKIISKQILSLNSRCKIKDVAKYFPKMYI